MLNINSGIKENGRAFPELNALVQKDTCSFAVKTCYLAWLCRAEPPWRSSHAY